MDNGWIKLYRQLLNNPICNDPLRLKAWIYLLLIVNHEDRREIIKGNYTTIKRGSTARSLRSLSELFGCNVKTTKRILDQLQNEGMITYRSIPGYTTVLTINKYREFQDFKDQFGNTEGNIERNIEGNIERNIEGNIERNIEGNIEYHTERNNERNNEGIGTINKKNLKNLNNLNTGDPAASDEAPTPKVIKLKFGSYKHVLLSESEVDKLRQDFGEAETEKAIRFLDEYIEMKGYKAKSHYLAIRKWVFSAIKEHEQREKQLSAVSKNKFNNFTQNDYDFDDLANKLISN